jgi:hypothetical protein
MKYHVVAPYEGCDETMAGWTVWTDDDGATDDLIADFQYRADAIRFSTNEEYIKKLKGVLLDLVIFSGAYLEETKECSLGSVEADTLRASRRQAQDILRLL